MKKNIFLLLIIMISLNSCKDSDIESLDFVGNWTATVKNELYINGDLDETFKASEEMKFSLAAKGTGTITKSGDLDTLIWAYVPTREMIYFYIEDSVAINRYGTMEYQVIEVNKKSQFWRNESEISNPNTGETYRYVYTMDIIRD